MGVNELVKAELEANYEKYFSVVIEDEEGQVWVPLEEVYDAVKKAAKKVKEDLIL